MSAPRSAAEWFAKRRGPRDPTLEQEFDRWLASDASHGGAYALCEAAWALSAGPAQVAAERRSTRVRTLRACAGFLALAAGVAAVAFWFWPAPAQAWSTLAGEQRTLTLADGSTVVLNTRTRIHVRLSHRTREVELDEGEAFFEVAHDALRPFTVQTRLGSARAVGTHFNVDLRPSRLVVTTTEGRVLVRSVSTGAGVYVDPGHRAALESGAARPLLGNADPAAALNWRAGRIEVDAVPLRQVLEEFSRYTTLPVRAADAQTASLRVTAVLRAGDLGALRSTLKAAFGLTLEERPDAYLVRPASAGH